MGNREENLDVDIETLKGCETGTFKIGVQVWLSSEKQNALNLIIYWFNA